MMAALLRRHVRGWSRRTFLGVLVAFVCAAPVMAFAQNRSDVIEGVVVAVNRQEVIIDLGRTHGLPELATLELLRRVEVTHPVSGDVIVDRFPIGAITFSEVGEVLSVGEISSNIERPPQVGDFVLFRPDALTPVPDAPTPAQGPIFEAHQLATRGGSGGVSEDQPGAASANGSDPVETALQGAFEQTLGEPLDARVLTWEQFLARFPGSQYTDEVVTELRWLRQQLDEARLVTATPLPDPLESDVSAPLSSHDDAPIVLVASIRRPETVEQVRALVRRPNDVTFETLEFERDGDHTWRLELPETWQDVGAVEYFVEAVRDSGDIELLDGQASRPRALAVVARATDAPEAAERSRARFDFDVVSFTTGSTPDYYLQFEAEYRYALDVWKLTGFSVGAGYYDGEGAALEVVQAGGPTRAQTVSYGFAEFELGLAPYVGLAWRLMAGNLETESDVPLREVFGQQLRLRIGELEQTRLEIGGALTDSVGNELWAEFFIETIERWPISAGVVVSNLPVDEDLGARLTVSAGYQATNWLAVSLRTGVNARTVQDFGFSAGLGLQLDW